MAPAFQVAFNKWLESRARARVLSICGLLEGTSAVYGAGFHFSYSHQHDMTGLLPCRSKLQMEAKVQRCAGAREMLASLRDVALNQLDAAMCLTVMAQTGLYDGALCDDSMHVLYDHHAVLTSQQITEVLYSVGVMQHRHVHQSFLSARVDPRRCTAEAVRRWVVGLAMLRQPPKDSTTLMNGLFLHGLHASRHRPTQDGTGSWTGTPTFCDVADTPRRKNRKRNSSRDAFNTFRSSARGERADPVHAGSAYALPPHWYLDCAHALACLSILHHKFILMTARQCRRGGAPASLSVHRRCQLLYAFGHLSESTAPHDLRSVWQTQVKGLVNATVNQLQRTRNDSHDARDGHGGGDSYGMTCEEGAWVMQALIHAGVRQHSCIPRSPALVSCVHPAQALVQTWAPISTESIVPLSGNAVAEDTPSPPVLGPDRDTHTSRSRESKRCRADDTGGVHPILTLERRE